MTLTVAVYYSLWLLAPYSERSIAEQRVRAMVRVPWRGWRGQVKAGQCGQV